MPVSATTDKDTLRVSFSIEGEIEGTNPHRHETEIVSFLRISEAGLEIVYSHHTFSTRETTVGPFINEITRRMALTPALIAIVEQGVFYEFWTTFNRIVKTSPAPVGKLPSQIE